MDQEHNTISNTEPENHSSLHNSPGQKSPCLHSNSSFPFHYLILDCIDLIFHYHVFDRVIGINEDGKVSMLLENPNTNFIETPEWKFLQRFAHCLFFDQKREPLGTCIGMSFSEFLLECRHASKCSFRFLNFRTFDDAYFHGSDVVQVMRGVKELCMAESSPNDSQCRDVLDVIKHIRGIENLILLIPETAAVSKLCDEDSQNLRGIRELKLIGCDLGEDSEEITQHIFENIRGVRALGLRDCILSNTPILKNLRGIEYLFIKNCYLSLPSSEFKNLRGIRELGIFANNFSLTDQHVESLRGVDFLSVLNNERNGPSPLTDAAFRNLRGISTLCLISGEEHVNVSDAAFVNLRGVQSLVLARFPHITSTIFEHLRGIKELELTFCPKIAFNAETLRNLRGIEKLVLYSFGDGAEKLHLTPECLEQLVGVKKLRLGNVVTVCDEAFRHLAHTTALQWSAASSCDPENTPLSEVAFSYLKSVKSLYLLGLRLEGVNSFPDLIMYHMPELKSFQVDDCRVLKSALEEIPNLRLNKLQYRTCEDSDDHVIASFDGYEFLKFVDQSRTESESESGDGESSWV